MLLTLTTKSVAPPLRAPTSPPSKAVVDHWPPYDDDLYGPHFINANPSAETWYEDVFSTKLMPGAKYFLKVNNPAPGASGAVGNFSVKLNGVYVADPGMMGGQSELVKEVPLQAFNRIEVWTAPGSGQLRVIIRMEPMTHIAPAYAERVQPAPGQADVTKSWQVTVPSDAGGNRILVIDNGDYDRSGRIGAQEWGEIKINGVHAATFDTLHLEQSKLVVPVNLPNGTSTIQATLNQVVPGAHVHVRLMYADTAKPELTVSAPVNGAVVSSPSVTVGGTYNDPMWGSVNVGNAQSYQSVPMAHLAGVQSWSVSHPLNVGPNTIKIWARDGAGNTSDTVTRVVTRQSGGGTTMTVAVQGRNPGVTVERDECLTIAAGDNAAYECGDLRLVHELPVTRTMNREHAPALIYNSSHASGRAIIAADVTVPAGTNADSLEATVIIPAKPNTVRKFAWNAAWSGAGARRIVVPIHGPTVGLPTGMYPYTLQVRALSGASALATGSDTGTVVVIDRSASPYGAGWWLSGLEQLINVSATQKLWVGGDGSTRLYVQSDSTTWLATPMVDRPDTLRRVGAVWQRRLRNGVYVEFNGAQQHVATVNRQGHRTVFTYDSTGVSTISLPVPAATSRVYTFTYAGTPKALTLIAAPPVGAEPRLTQLGYRTGTRLVDSLAGPDNRWIDLRYDASNRVDGRRNRRGDWTFFAYNEAELLRQVTIDMSRTSEPAIVTSFCPAESRSVASCASGPQPLASVYSWLDGPRTDVIDTTTFTINQFGAPSVIVNALGHRTTIERTDARFPMLPTALVTPAGFRTEAIYNARGLLDSTSAINPLADGRNAGTRYRWHPKWAMVVQTVLPTGQKDSIFYDDATGNRLWQQDGRGTMSRVSFRYYANNLLRVIETPNGARDSVDYDATLANLAVSLSPLGKRTELYQDLIGRDTLTRTALNSALSSFIREVRRYDIRDLDTLNITTASGVSQPDSVYVRKRYDAEGNADTVATRSGPDINGIGWIRRAFVFDAAHRQIREQLVGGNVITTTYDPSGNLKAGGREGAVSYTYDAINRPLTRDGEELAAFTYDEIGLRTADNPYARISRRYYPNGALDTDSIAVSASDTALRDFSRRYGVRYTYDLRGRRISVAHPSDIAPVAAAQTQYAYDPVTGALATVTDVFGNRFIYHYDANGRLDTLTSIADSPERIIEARGYDLDDQLIRRIAGGSGAGAGSLRNETITYDFRGKMLSNGFHSATFTPLGALKTAALGGGDEFFVPDALGNNQISGVGSLNANHRFAPNTGLLTFTERMVPGSADTTNYFYQATGASGETVLNQYAGGEPPNVQRIQRTTRNNYTRDNKLTSVFVDVDSLPRPPFGVYYPYRFEESYRYDALGRRIEARVWRTTNCQFKDLPSGCQNTLTRTIWDGAQVLYELRWVFPTADTVPLNWQTAAVPPSDQYNGAVGYTHGLGVDQPLDLLRDQPVVPHANWRGMFDQGTCPTDMCDGSIGFPGRDASSYGAIEPSGLRPWYGTLIGGMTDASGYLYRRNRYADPRTGRFTQEDPIGLAGGLNLYGFANGDPVNFGDPFGLTPCWLIDYRQCKNAEFLAGIARFFQNVQAGAASVFSGQGVYTGPGYKTGQFLGLAGIVAPTAKSSLGVLASEDAASSATTIVGRRGFEVSVRPGTNSPAVIGGRQYTGHALDQMQGRGITPSMVEETIRTGRRTAGRDGATIYTTQDMRVIVNPSGSIKTTMWQ